MKWKKVIAVFGSVMLLTQSMSGAIVTASQEEQITLECETEEQSEFETEIETEYCSEEEEESEEEQTEEQSEVQQTETENVTEVQPETEAETEAVTESEKTEPVTEKETEISQSESETENSSEAETEIAEPETEPEKEKESEKPERATETDKETEGTSFEGEDASAPGGSYQSSYWDASWYISPDFRFTQVDKEAAIAEPERMQVNVYDTSAKAGNVVGILPYFSLVYILEEGDTWSYIESGDVRGFVENKELKTGSYAKEIVEEIGEYALNKGEEIVSPYENHAFTYTHTTTKEVVAEKQYGITLYSCDIKEYPYNASRAIGEAQSGNLIYILEIDESGWYFVESGDVRGFIDPSLVIAGNVAEDFLETADVTEPFVEEIVKPEDNENLYYTLKSVKVAGSGVGSDIAETAMSFINRLGYVWGGTSLTTGADCSGFVQSIFSEYGINLPRLAEEQGANGMEITSLSDAKPGDIVYYACGPHVGIYVGNNFVVQCSGDSYNDASNPGKGPTLSQAAYMPITSIRRYLIEEQETRGVSGNRLDLTTYSEEQLELIWAIVAQEDNGSYEGALAVISSAMNRSESPRWGYCGGNALAQLTAGGQYCYSLDNYWRSRLNGNVPEYVKQAVNDCLRKGIRNHGYTSFRSTKGKTTGNDAQQIGGNWYFGT